jgi:peptidoglycan/LPS O-acetylase OafA/YrhL
MPLLILFAWLLARPELAHGSLRSQTWDSVWIWLVGAGLIGVILLHRGVLTQVLSHRWFVWLGRISYGLYMYHEMTLMLGRWMIGRIGWFPNREILTSVFCLALTVGVAAASYYGFERPFLRLKGRWTRVASRPV